MITAAQAVCAVWDGLEWQPQPRAAEFVRRLVDAFCVDCPAAGELAQSLRNETGTRLSDWIDSLALPADDGLEERLHGAGFLLSDASDGPVWEHPQGLFPRIYQCDLGPRRMAVRVESVADFLVRHGIGGTHIDGAALARLRRAKIGSGRNAELWVVERHGYRGWYPPSLSLHELQAVLWHWDRFRERKRRFADDEAGFEHAGQLLRPAVEDLGPGRASDLFFSAEREYWTARNRAGQFQKARQDALGLGWANHDHHGYRSSRGRFAGLIRLLEGLGFQCRERFCDDGNAGWGTQVLAHPESSVVVFADVHLGPGELAGDFAHLPLGSEGNLAPSPVLGPIGLWCKLHGESLLQAGMHHLECRFDLDAAREQLQQGGIEVMKLRTDLPYLKQAFVQGEVWPVDFDRIRAALATGIISREQADEFQQAGVLGSHLGLLQREEGYKGSHQASLGVILRSTPSLA